MTLDGEVGTEKASGAGHVPEMMVVSGEATAADFMIYG
jgi:hypothetical protein